ncbi:TonB family protein [Sphingomonas sp. RB56-2]|uniref:TonB family protein n=1 Tax=Sphingomonas brevis TaxID=2908206 RepID=A0ABT0SB13_9SPHN|nr:energy transducer TonB [Sphingomonas brevis]MCL6741523.1 TonB family protein [Sphingomonas brevis]
MLAYAADSPRTAERTGSPKALTLIVAGHALALAAVLTARPEIIERMLPKPITVVDVRVPPPEPAEQVKPLPRRPITQPSFIDQERPIIDMGQQLQTQIDTDPSIADIGAVIGSGPTIAIDPPRHVPVMTGPRLATSEESLKPPYPNDKLRAEEEATLRLKLTIDARGRVTAVDPVGAADPSFLAAARKHIIRSWRYKPATEDGVAIPTTTMISLSFRLEDV